MSKKGNQDHPEVKEESEEEIRKEIEKYQKKLKIAVFNHRVRLKNNHSLQSSASA